MFCRQQTATHLEYLSCHPDILLKNISLRCNLGQVKLNAKINADKQSVCLEQQWQTKHFSKFSINLKNTLTNRLLKFITFHDC